MSNDIPAASISPAETFKTHVSEKSPAQKLAEHDAAAAARNAKLPGVQTAPGEQPFKPTPITFETIVGASLAAVFDWLDRGVDLKTVELPMILDDVRTKLGIAKDTSPAIESEPETTETPETPTPDATSGEGEGEGAETSGESEKTDPASEGEGEGKDEDPEKTDPEPDGKPGKLKPAGPKPTRRPPSKTAAKKAAKKKGKDGDPPSK